MNDRDPAGWDEEIIGLAVFVFLVIAGIYGLLVYGIIP